MKKWNAPEVEELNIEKTANGWWDVDWEGPCDGWFTDGESKSNKNDKTNQES